MIIKQFAVLVAVGGMLSMSGNASAAILFESGTLGPTGIPQGSVAATNVTTSVFVGVRFQLSQPVISTEIGGHFVGQGNFFGAIVSLANGSDFPDSEDLSTPDVLDTTTLLFPTLSGDTYGTLSASLEPGWYAVVFGSGLFGTNGDGAAPRNNTDVGLPSYIGKPTSSGWLDLAPLSTVFVDHRFVVLGDIVPEPTSAVMACMLGLFSLFHRRTARLSS